jgi:hypothetical protein
VYLADALLRSNDLAGATEHARAAVETASAGPSRAYALAVWAQVLLAAGSGSEAAKTAGYAMDLLQTLGGMDEGEALVRLVHARALALDDKLEEARAAIGAARDRLLSRAAKIGEPKWRQSFLERVAENALTLELARDWLGEPSPGQDQRSEDPS